MKHLISCTNKSVHELLNKPWNLNEVDAMGKQLCSRILSTLKMKDPVQELNDTLQSLQVSSLELQTIIDTTVFKGPDSKSAHEKPMLGSGKKEQENEARVFVRKNEGLPAHEILGVACDAMMPEITKAYRALSKRFHSDKVKEADKEDYDQAMKMINDARETMVRAFNS